MPGFPILAADFWTLVDRLVSESQVMIDRPQGSPHPRFPDMIYPLNYGYLAGTRSSDGSQVDVWLGSLRPARVVGCLLTVDLGKHDMELKILLGCTTAEISLITAFCNSDLMQVVPVLRNQEPDSS